MNLMKTLVLSITYYLLPIGRVREFLENNYIESLVLSKKHKQCIADKYLQQVYARRSTDTGFIEAQLTLEKTKEILIAEQESNLHGRRFFIESIFKNKLKFLTERKLSIDKTAINLIVTLGYSSLVDNIQLLYPLRDKPLLFLEAAFLRSILMDKSASKFDRAICFFADDLGHHYDPNHPSRIEYLLNRPAFKLNQEEFLRASNLMKNIVENKLTKYNDQPTLDKLIGRPDKEKILVIEQARNDWAILKSGGSENSFEAMLERAIADNPDSDILVKIHPDTLDGKRGGLEKSYYGDHLALKNIYKINEKINPYSLIEQCSKVYVFSSMFGFEALMAGKEVHVFGLPSYAGWGLTIDYQKCERRKQNRTLQELVYAIYFIYTIYIDEQGYRCTPEQAIDYLLKLRNEFLEEASA